MSNLPFAATTPIHVSRVALRARDADNLARFYETVVGLRELGREGNAICLGTGNRELLRIESDPSAETDNPRSAGLFHTAFLLPERVDLARWLRHAAEKRLPISGASDHLVSEAIYLDDPEGNGIEIYRDRMPDEWKWNGTQVEMATVRLDAEDLLGSLPDGDAGWHGVPDNAIVGHIHLRVGDPRQAESWWHDNLGFDMVARYGDAAAFMSTGGYHHHVGANVWQSRGAGPRDPKRAGLSWFELSSREAKEPESFRDPWGTEVRVVTKD
jgi:catechol 2,3-dioxygenase